MAVALWGPQWAGTRVCSLCDNAAVVCAINKKPARDPTLFRLLCLLALLCAVYDIALTARHLPGVQNTSADALSRNRLHMFLSLNPQASPMPTPVVARVGIQQRPTQHLADLDKEVEGYLGKCVTPAIRAAYASAQRRYANFCQKFRIVEPYPLSEGTLCRFVAFLAHDGLPGLRFAEIHHDLG